MSDEIPDFQAHVLAAYMDVLERNGVPGDEDALLRIAAELWTASTEVLAEHGPELTLRAAEVLWDDTEDQP